MFFDFREIVKIGDQGRGKVWCLSPARIADRIRKAPLLFVAFAGIGGIALADARCWGAFFCGLCLIAGAGLASWRKSRAFAHLLIGGALAWALLAVRHQCRLAEIRSFPLASALAAGQTIEVAGEGWVADTVDREERSLRTILRIETIQVKGRDLPCNHQLPCRMLGSRPDLGYGTRVRFTGRLLPLKGPAVPGGFDAAAFYFRQAGSLGSLEVRDGDRLEILPGREGRGLVRYAFAMRNRLEEALLLGVPAASEPYARLIGAMALGARENSPEALEEAFRVSGTMHLFAVSGLNVAIVAGMMVWLAAWAGIPKSRAIPAIIPAVLFYAVLTGLSASAVRAALMASVLLAGYSLRERPRLLNSLGFAALILLVWDTQPLFLPGFQLSFAVVMFIAILAPLVSEGLSRPWLADPFLPRRLIGPVRRHLDRCTGGVAALLAVSLASWLGSLGLLAWHFESVAPVGIVANVFMVPVATAIMAGAAVSLTAYGLHLTWATIAANRATLLLSFLLSELAQFFASWPGATVHVGPGRVAGEPGVLRVDVVGEHGDGAALLEFPRDGGGAPVRWLLDTGSDHTYQGRVLPLLRHRGINGLDVLVLTHGDEGHLGGAVSALNQFRPPLLLEPSVKNRSPSHPAILAQADRIGAKRVELERGQGLALGHEIKLRVLHPDPARPGRLADDRALVLKWEFAGRTLLFSSDSGYDTETLLLQSGADLRAEVWIRGQHADGPSGLGAFVEAVSPRAVISSHADFPEKERISEVLRRGLAARRIPLFEVDGSGAVSVEVGKEAIRIAPFSDPGAAIVLPPDEKTY